MENIYSTIASASKNSPKLVGFGIMGFLFLTGYGLYKAVTNAVKEGREISCGIFHVGGAVKQEKDIVDNNQEKINNTETN